MARELTVIGIMPPGFTGLTGRGELWFPAVQAPRLTYPEYLTTNQNFISVVARLRPGARSRRCARSSARSGAAIQRALPSQSEVPGDRFGATAVSLGEVRVNATTRRAMLVLLGAVARRAPARVRQRLAASSSRMRRRAVARWPSGSRSAPRAADSSGSCSPRRCCFRR